MEEELFDGVKHQKVYGVEPVEKVLGRMSFLVVVQGKGHCAEDGGGFPVEGYGGGEDGQVAVVAEEVHQGEGEDAFVAVVGFENVGDKGGGGDHQEVQECTKYGLLDGLVEFFQGAHHEETEEECPHDVLVVGADRGLADGEVEGDFGQQGEEQEVSAVGFAVVGVFEALYEHEEVQGEGDTADGAHEAVQAVKCLGVGVSKGAVAAQDAVKEDNEGCVVDEHGNQGDPL